MSYKAKSDDVRNPFAKQNTRKKLIFDGKAVILRASPIFWLYFILTKGLALQIDFPVNIHNISCNKHTYILHAKFVVVSCPSRITAPYPTHRVSAIITRASPAWDGRRRASRRRVSGDAHPINHVGPTVTQILLEPQRRSVDKGLFCSHGSSCRSRRFWRRRRSRGWKFRP